ncbi:endoplasmic reticulum mannosyl-oligosaccharide 1,2-alpha-mannosidase [Colletotrichum spaethianum]|uniref:alpha-1,2-Mannosidase n=1 Tax=Colletotrichum spaethianum TaxID=700344 RepID=A0AA37LIZ7_9PEZI|nr:endoplasmic reticulum mannosyl-oligosaccharide 1,2-alpha-mannosidase [Colletotrichum spaethianum]GKT47129.1 endoplasmic reticulum mannosyl-oligosaccharide 1,2-alpha-mannosidase [Colletotrichum spaethianum]
MIVPRRPPRLTLIVVFVFVAVLLLYNPYWLSTPVVVLKSPDSPQHHVRFRPSSFNWSAVRQFYPISDAITPLPNGRPLRLPRVQNVYGAANPHPEATKRQKAVRDVFKKNYDSYKRYAWTHDELTPARELGDMLYMGFDTPNRIPGFWLNFEDAKKGTQLAGLHDPSTSPCSLSLEFTRLSQLTGDMKYFDAINRITRFLERTQYQSKLPGMWPKMINFREERVDTDNGFSLGALADSLYEYLPKMYTLLGGLDKTYEKMYVGAMAIVEQHLLFRPMTEDDVDILFAGDAYIYPDRVDHIAEGQHLSCFVGGMLGLGGKLFAIDNHIDLGDRVARGCAWAYDAMPSGLMPEIFNLIACSSMTGNCRWDEKRWEQEGDKRLRKGFKNARDPKYILRPEAIESVFLLYRMTGQQDLQDIAWNMFQSAIKATRTEFANSAIADVTVPSDETQKTDSMESFWLSQTLKYYYLIFSSPELISLDEYVFNTEAHPFRLPT